MKIKVLFGIFGILLASTVLAELDPELAAANNKNDGGFFVGTGLSLGQAYATGGSTPGIAALLSFEPGYVAPRDSWGRIETSLEIATGMMNFRRKGEGKAKVDLGIGALILAKIGYGWSLGSGLFSSVKVGAGPVSSSYTAKANGITSKSDGPLTGIAGQLGYELRMPINDNFDVLGGLRITHLAFDIDDVKTGGETVRVNEPLNLNVPAINVGIRYQF